MTNLLTCEQMALNVVQQGRDSTDCMNDDVGSLRNTDQITELNRLGKEGWDVVSIRRLYLEYAYEGIEVYLKRPIKP